MECGVVETDPRTCGVNHAKTPCSVVCPNFSTSKSPESAFQISQTPSVLSQKYTVVHAPNRYGSGAPTSRMWLVPSPEDVSVPRTSPTEATMSRHRRPDR